MFKTEIMGLIMNDLRAALAMARQTRTCPPLRIIRDPNHHEAVAGHKRICPVCAGGRDEDLAPWEELTTELARLKLEERPVAEDPPPAAGQIRYLRADLGRWKDDCYYTPPAVLLLEPIVGLEGAFRAAQIHFDPELAAPGDLVLDHERTGTGDLMVECWNTYPVTAESLGPAVGCLAPEILAAAQRMARDPGALPTWAVNPPAMREHDPRIYFRELEVEVQYLFASEAVAWLLHRAEGRGVQSSADEVADFLSRRFGRDRVPQGWTLPEEILAAFEPPLEELSLAAADSTARAKISAKRVLLSEGRVKEVRPIAAWLKDEGATESGRFATVEFLDPVPDDVESWAFCLLFRAGGAAKAAVRVDWDPKRRLLVADFDSPYDGPAEIRLALFVEASRRQER